MYFSIKNINTIDYHENSGSENCSILLQMIGAALYNTSFGSWFKHVERPNIVLSYYISRWERIKQYKVLFRFWSLDQTAKILKTDLVDK